MRRFGLLWVLVATVAGADATVVRKPAPSDLPPESLDTYVDAVIADKRGDYERAISHYERAADRKDFANIAYNIADLYRRMERWDRAIEGYKKYLQLAPRAPDARAVARLVAQLEKTPGVVVVDGEDLDAVVFVDGKLIGASPLVMPLPDGAHAIDRIGPASYRHDSLRMKPQRIEHFSSYGTRAGNVVMSSPIRYGGSWHDRDHTFQIPGRFTLPPGRYDTFFFQPGKACSPISFEVPATPDTVVFVYVDGPPDPKSGACIPIKVSASKIQFPPGSN